jgi:hypothetical protein
MLQLEGLLKIEISVISLIARLSELCVCRLDVGEGKDVDLPECPRALLKKQCIRYLGPVRHLHHGCVSLFRTCDIYPCCYLQKIYILAEYVCKRMYDDLTNIIHKILCQFHEAFVLLLTINIFSKKMLTTFCCRIFPQVRILRNIFSNKRCIGSSSY